jgi:ABC-type multidrug transport system fused ATPase/permease subunit
VVLFSGSIAENIAYGTPGATVEQIQEAANQVRKSIFRKATVLITIYRQMLTTLLCLSRKATRQRSASVA